MPDSQVYGTKVKGKGGPTLLLLQHKLSLLYPHVPGFPPKESTSLIGVRTELGGSEDGIFLKFLRHAQGHPQTFCLLREMVRLGLLFSLPPPFHPPMLTGVAAEIYIFSWTLPSVAPEDNGVAYGVQNKTHGTHSSMNFMYLNICCWRQLPHSA